MSYLNAIRTGFVTMLNKPYRDLPEGSPSPAAMRARIFAIAWPSVIELVLISLCQVVDMIMVGQLGAYAIAAVGLTVQPRFMILSVFFALNTGTTALIARFRGQDDQKLANAVLRQSLLIAFCASILFSAGGYFGSRWMIQFMGAQADTLGPATDYLQIQMLALTFNVVGLAITAALRGVGNTRASMYMNLIANAVNVVLNYGLIYGKLGMPRMEVAGASLATAISSVIACAIGFSILFKGRQYVFLTRHDDYRPNFAMVKRILRIGLPSMVEQLLMRAGLLIYTRTVSGLGTMAFAAHQICLNLLSISFMNGQAFGIAATTLTGQSLGQDSPRLAQAYTSSTRRMGLMGSILIASVFFFFGGPLASLYTKEAEIIGLSAQVMIIVALLQPFQNSNMIILGSLRGAGDTRWPAVIMFIGILIIRPATSIAFVDLLDWGLMGAWYALVCDQLMRSLLSYIRFRSGKWLSVKV